MNCNYCEKTAEFLCKCSIPNIYLCFTDLDAHTEEIGKNHIIEDLKEIKLLIELRDKLRKINEEIIIISSDKIKDIEEKTMKVLSLNNEVIENLYEKYSEGILSKLFYNKLMINDFYEASVRISFVSDLIIKKEEEEKQVITITDKFGKYKGELQECLRVKKFLLIIMETFTKENEKVIKKKEKAFLN